MTEKLNTLEREGSRVDLAALIPEYVLRDLVDQRRWPPHPWLHDREDLKLSDDSQKTVIQQGHRWIENATPWETIPLSSFMAFHEKGDRQAWEVLFQRRRWRIHDLVCSLWLEPDEALFRDLADGLWLMLEEASWCAPTHLDRRDEYRGVNNESYPGQRPGPWNDWDDYRGAPDPDNPILDLFAAESASLLSTCLILFRNELDALSPLLGKRIRKMCLERCINPYLERDDYWWMGCRKLEQRINNWNPWITSNVIWAAFNLELPSETLNTLLSKVLRVLQAFLDDTPADGGCDEGPLYWTHASASFFDCLETMNLLAGGRLEHLWEVPRFRRMADYIGGMYIGNGWWLNYADAVARIRIHSHLIWRCGRNFNSDSLRDLALEIKQYEGRPGFASVPRTLYSLSDATYQSAGNATYHAADQYILPETQVGVLRKSIREHRLLISMKGGHNNESHNHNDLGHVIVFIDEEPFLIDPGVETYRKESFNDQRYSIWTMRSGWHNLPIVNGEEQPPGRQFRGQGFVLNEDGMLVDLSKAYAGPAQLEKYCRHLTVEKDSLVIRDCFIFSREANDVCLHWIIPSDIDGISDDMWSVMGRPLEGALQTASGHLRVSDPPARWEVEKVEIVDPKLKNIWGSYINRLKLHYTSVGRKWEISTSIHPS